MTEATIRTHNMLAVMLAQIPVGTKVEELEAQVTELLRAEGTPDSIRQEFRYDTGHGYIPSLADAITTAVFGGGLQYTNPGLETVRILQGAHNVARSAGEELTEEEIRYLTSMGQRISTR